jgi:6-phosphogluconolactonase
MIHFDSKNELESTLCKQIAADLNVAIQQNGKATILLSGGSTPSGVYRLLSQETLDWSRITIGLVDERFVAADSPFSNFKLLRETIAQNQARSVQILPMVVDPTNYEENLRKVEESYRIFTEPDVVLLGMGPDGHTASIFPNDTASEKANLKKETILSNTTAPAEPTQRITFNGPVLRNAKKLYLMITGIQKKEIFENSEANNLPIASFVSALNQIYFTPAL